MRYCRADFSLTGYVSVSEIAYIYLSIYRDLSFPFSISTRVSRPPPPCRPSPRNSCLSRPLPSLSTLPLSPSLVHARCCAHARTTAHGWPSSPARIKGGNQRQATRWPHLHHCLFRRNRHELEGKRGGLSSRNRIYISYEGGWQLREKVEGKGERFLIFKNEDSSRRSLRRLYMRRHWPL